MAACSIGVAASRLTSVAKLPNVFGWVFWIVNTVAEFAMPVITYGIGLVLEYKGHVERQTLSIPASFSSQCNEEGENAKDR